MEWLRQSTAVVKQFGPFEDKTDGVTHETGLVSALDHASTGIMLAKNGGTLTIRNATVTASTYDAHGHYKVTLDTTDTNTLGKLRMVYTDPATCLPVWMDFMVVPAMIYDAIILGSDRLDVNLTHMSDTEQSARDLGASVLLSPGTGTGQLDLTSGVPKANVTQLLGTAWLTPGTAGTPDVNAKLHGGTAQTGRDIGASVLLSAGTGTGQLDFTSGVVKANWAQILGTAITGTAAQLAAAITKFFNVATPTGTVNSLPDAVPSAPGGLPLVSDLSTDTDIEDAVLDAVLADHLTAGSVGAGINSASSAGDPWATAIPGAYGAGAAGKIVGDNLNETVSSRSSQTSVDLVKDKTDSLTFTQAGHVDANIQRVNDVVVIGTGASGNRWLPE